MQHINLVEYSSDRNVCLCSLMRLSIYSHPIIVFICALSHVSKSVSVIYYVCHCSLDCIRPCSLQRLFLHSLPRLSLFSVTSLFSLPRLFSISLFSILQRFTLFSPASVSVLYSVCHCSLPRLSLFSTVSVIILYRVCHYSLPRLSLFSAASVIFLYRFCLCVLDLFCLFFLGAS
jgi:hypothetical protein